MIDIENDLFDELEVKLSTAYPDLNMVGEEQNAPAVFPTVSFVETDNVRPIKYDDSADEAYNEVTYTVEIYTNNRGTKKTEAKKILNLIDDFMSMKGFRRILKQPISMNNSTIYRIITRYSGVVSPNKEIYGR